MKKVSAPLPPGSTVGILGGGQLARMLSLAAARLGIDCHIYAPEADSPAFAVSAAKTVARYDDFTALEAFARQVDVVTYEFENVPGDTAGFLAAHVPVAPGVAALKTASPRRASSPPSASRSPPSPTSPTSPPSRRRWTTSAAPPC